MKKLQVTKGPHESEHMALISELLALDKTPGDAYIFTIEEQEYMMLCLLYGKVVDAITAVQE